ncbi:PREDICTED: spermatid maturation protein 1 [Condylura cristata]|uniref:spermatid maturation protein 1 n=1 Tax=Condylura cristata TaxID=143302 RepID=UPI0003344E37|nr:PREDICTED: spermatid maturation protein 1 [Condylura cristata]
MAMAEQPRPGWTSYHNPHTNNCQDLGNSILLLLGLIICINIGINMVTLLWHRLRGFLHQVFHILCEKEVKPCPPEKQSQPPKQSSPTVHLRCTMDPVKMTVTPPPVRRHRRRGSSRRRAHRPLACHDTDEEKPPHHCPAFCSHNWDVPPNWEGYRSTQGFWVPWAQDALEPPSQTIRFQQTIGGRPLKREMRSELGLEAYVYPVNPPPPSPQAPNHKTNGAGAGAEAEQEQCPPAPPPIQGPAFVPEVPRRGSSARIVYDARDVRRRLRELTREVEALAHCYPMITEHSAMAEETGKDWIYRHLPEK